MNYFFTIIRKQRVLYIIIISLTATVLIINTTLEFTERIIRNPILLIVSLLVFYTFTLLAIEYERKKQNKSKGERTKII